MNVKDILTNNEDGLVSIDPQGTILQAIRLSNDKKVGALAVIDDNELVGIITEGDIIKECDERHDLINKTRVIDVMSENVIIALPEDDLGYAIGTMVSNNIRYLPVMDKQDFLGMITIDNILRVLSENDEFKDLFPGQEDVEL